MSQKNAYSVSAGIYSRFGVLPDLPRTSFNRSSFTHEPPGFNRASRRLDQIEQAQANAHHLERSRQSCADMADLIEHAKAGEFREAD